MLLSGDFLFVGSLGRPDLIGEDAKRALAGKLYDSVSTKLAPLPDFVEVNPAHGAGSMCGSGMSARPMTTLGFERLANPYLRKGLTRDAFIDEILGHVPPFPPYYKLMKVLNSRGAEPFDTDRELEAIRAREFHQLVASGHVVIDLRDQLAFGAGHIPGSFGIGSWGSLSTWAAWVVPYETPILLVGARNEPMEEAVRSLARVGLDDVRGYLDGGIEKWIAAGYPVTHVRQLTPAEFVEVRQETPMHVVDVRTNDEWKGGHVSGARHIMGGKLSSTSPSCRATRRWRWSAAAATAPPSPPASSSARASRTSSTSPAAWPRGGMRGSAGGTRDADPEPHFTFTCS